MYKTINIFYTFIVAVLLLNISACAKDKPASAPATDARDQFVGTWKCNDRSTQGIPMFIVTISKETTNQAYLRIYNFNNYGNAIYAKAVANFQNLIIPQQQVPGPAAGYTVEGSGQLVGGQLTMTYSVDDGFNSIENFSFLCIK